jgi:hypothetical protein
MWKPFPLKNPFVYPGDRLLGFDPTHPASQNGVTLSAVAATGSGIQVAGQFAIKPSTITGTSANVVDGIIGPCMQPATNNNAQNNFVTWQLGGGAAYSVKNTHTLAGICRPLAINGGTNSILMSEGTFAGAAAGSFQIGYTTAGKWSFTAYNISIPVPPFSVVAGVPVFVAMSASSAGTTATFNTILVNLNTGSIQTSTQTNSPITTPTPNAVNMGSNSVANRSFGGNVAAIMVSNSFLSLNQLIAWANDPWSFWYPPTVERIITSSLIAPAAPSPFAQTDWPLPTAPYRIEQTWTRAYNLNLIAQDRMLAGEQIYDRPQLPIPPPALTWTQTPAYEEIAKPFYQSDWPNPTQPYRLDQTWTWVYNKNLIGKDQLPVGEQIYELTQAQKPYEQQQLHSWQWNYNLNLIGQDRMLVGEQVWERPQLPIPPALTWTQTPAYEEIAKPFNQTDWPLPTAPYRIEQTWTFVYNKNLVGQDKLPIGAELTDLPPRDFARILQTWIENTNLALLTAPPDLKQQVHIFDYPNPRGAEPDWRRSWEFSYNKNLIGQDRLPFRQQDWPNPQRVVERAGDWIQQTKIQLAAPTFIIRQNDWLLPQAPQQAAQSWTASYNLNLIGKDQLPIGAEVYELAPSQKPAEQPQLRSWAWWYNQNLIGQDELPFRQSDWPLTPAAQRAIDLANWIDRVKWWLLTPFHQTDWPNPTQPFRDPTLGTIARGYNLDLLGADRLPNRQQDWPNPTAPEYTLLRAWILPLNVGLLAPPAFGLPLNAARFYDRPQLRTDVPADLYTITHAQQIPQPTPVVTPAVYNKPMLAGPGYLDVIPGEKPS